MREKIQSFGRFLSGMIMPNIGAFIAWGLITALFIPDGWFPNEGLASLVGPMINYLLPLLIGYTGGKLVSGRRGGVVGAVATMGTIVGANVPMFLGAMVMGPIGGWTIKKFDQAVEGKIKAGFEMLVNNFSSGIIGMLLSLLAYVVIGPIVSALNEVLRFGVEWIVNAGLLPLVSIIIEPAKVLFLNNALNHGVLAPIGVQQVEEMGKSIMFLLETNPGPGLGLLLAYWAAGKGNAKSTAPGSIIIHFFGGIHEIYFPYVLMKPSMILSVIAGGMTGVFTFVVTNAGLVATPSPGSIFAELAMTPPGSFIPVLSGIFLSALVSFGVGWIILKTTSHPEETGSLGSATAQMENMKGKKSSVSDQITESKDVSEQISKSPEEISKIIVACDAGMGSSAMAATQLRNKIQDAGLDINVDNSSIDEIPKDSDIVLLHGSLLERAKKRVPDSEFLVIENFMGSPVYDELVERLKKNQK
ncbi:MAG: PTS mannitol transporter subunit IICBA [Halanaerobiales bacterium]|nr:PTS mannitol transporter subunit IICBA [Halanaerobiales bacterium]